MTVLRNNFDGGPDGTTITVSNSGQEPGSDAFNVVSSAGSQVVLQYASAAALGRPSAEYVMRAGTGTTAGQPYVSWTTSIGSQTQIWLRTYMYYSVLPNNANSPVLFWAGNSGVDCSFIGINSAGAKNLFITDNTTANYAMTSGGITAARWFRVEARIQFSTSTGNAELRWYDNADSDTPTETISFSNFNLGASSANMFEFGYVYADTSLEDAYWSGLELNNTGWPGPAPFIAKGIPGIQPRAIAPHTDNW